MNEVINGSDVKTRYFLPLIRSIFDFLKPSTGEELTILKQKNYARKFFSKDYNFEITDDNHTAKIRFEFLTALSQLDGCVFYANLESHSHKLKIKKQQNQLIVEFNDDETSIVTKYENNFGKVIQTNNFDLSFTLNFDIETNQVTFIPKSFDRNDIFPRVLRDVVDTIGRGIYNEYGSSYFKYKDIKYILNRGRIVSPSGIKFPQTLLDVCESLTLC